MNFGVSWNQRNIFRTCRCLGLMFCLRVVQGNRSLFTIFSEPVAFYVWCFVWEWYRETVRYLQYFQNLSLFMFHVLFESGTGKPFVIYNIFRTSRCSGLMFCLRVVQGNRSLFTIFSEPVAVRVWCSVWEWYRETVRYLQYFQNLSLFGFDVLFESGTGKPFVIDINYFPGYDGFDEFHEHLSDMLYQATIS